MGVHAYVMHQHQPLLLAVFRHEGDAMLYRLLWIANSDYRLIDKNFTLVTGQAKNGLHHV
ncbi:hypothetical protein D3C76_1747020 [compost metagenome]